ncbi:MAG: hypothetical protein ABL949_02825 [Fimbriimonadaceae bacterium]
MAKGKRRFKFWHFLVCVVLLGAAGGGVFEWFSVRQAERAIAVEVTKLRALGIATSPDEMPKPGPDDRNAALIYQEAIRLRRALNLKKPTETSFGKPDLDYPTKLALYIKEFQPVLDLVKQAAALPDCSFRRDWSQGMNVLFPEFSELKEFVKAAMDKSNAEADRGNFTESFAWLRVGRQIAAHVREPTLISHLVSVAGESIVDRALQTQMRSHYAKPQFLEFARKFCEESIPLPSPRGSFSGEVLLVRTSLADIASGKTAIKELSGMVTGQSDGEMPSFDKLTIQALRVPSVRKEVERKLLARYRTMVEQMPTDPTQFEGLETATLDIDNEIRRDQSTSGKLASFFTPIFSSAGVTTASIVAKRRITRQGLEIFAYKVKTGFWPKSIDASKPWAIDPFTKKPFIYKLMPDGFGLYSIGSNRRDDQGAPQYEYPKGRPGPVDDIAFFRPRTPPKPHVGVRAAP